MPEGEQIFFNETQAIYSYIDSHCKCTNAICARARANTAEISITFCKINVYIVLYFHLLLQKLNLSHLIYISAGRIKTRLIHQMSTSFAISCTFFYTLSERSNVALFFVISFFSYARACVCVYASRFSIF